VPPYLVSNLRTLTGEQDLLPGLRVVRAPGHTPGSQALVVDTEHGSFAIAGDAVCTYENIDRDLPPGYHVDVDASMESLDALRGAADYLLPSHDYAVFTDGPVSEIGPKHGAGRQVQP
jgi:glyoxylase-like metal-dependent hydrolase (beta-lactamase superfamily II)